ncbi:hypothetical protein [Chryseobacterium vrystaatense]|uniref:HTH cro/C1-type domain-containing protein n=1 Tax=Chryseobacterium vrystaatense TaxID=307480 RepID=A0A1M5HFZ8_9FLAO|nr:hypothetical protein [Chryseobacterium vrystaatense]SHG14742.1 hypothetical protein SAMN02787073_3687 [Chryseobacterium vrystaatense]
MEYHKKIFRYKVAVGAVNKRLRESIIVSGKPMTQEYLNNDILEKYNIVWNAGREESLPNTTIENIYLICDYFKIEIDFYFQFVKKITDEEINDSIKSKKKLSRLHSLL